MDKNLINSLKGIQNIPQYFIKSKVLFLVEESKDLRIFVKNNSIKFNSSSFLSKDFYEKNYISLNFDLLINSIGSETKEIKNLNFIKWFLYEATEDKSKKIEFIIKIFLKESSVCDSSFLFLYKSNFSNKFNKSFFLQLKIFNKNINKLLLNKKQKDFNLKLNINSNKSLQTNINSLTDDILNLKMENSFIRFYFRDFFKYYFFKLLLNSYISRI